MRSLTSHLIVQDEDLEPQPILPVLNGEEQAAIVATHDKCIFNANDGQKFIWTHEDNNSI